MDGSRSPPPRIPPSTKIAKSHRFKEIDALSECCSLFALGRTIAPIYFNIEIMSARFIPDNLK
jgi:hypothetical protein